MTSRLKKAGLFTAIGALAIGIVGGSEGLRTKAYIPVKGDVPTICFGETRGVHMGDTKTVSECKAMLGNRLVEFETGMRKCLTNPDKIPDKTYVAFLSLTYNIGQRRFCESTVVRRANAGEMNGACNAITAFNKFKGKTLPGLVRRRAEERALCLEGLK